MRLWGNLLALVALLLAFWLGAAPDPVVPPGQSAAVAEEIGETISLAQLPEEGRQTLMFIKQGGPFPYSKDGTVFQNREGRLPDRQRGYYREYTVPTPGLSHRGALRIVSGQEGDHWYTQDHYRSFKRIQE
ncbi:MAG: ribonuclease domain-containing protein [Pseudomonadota bacterium]